MLLRHPALLSIGLLLSVAVPSFAADVKELGTAGRYRFLPVVNCGQPYLAQSEGACDPPPVTESLSPAEKVQAHLDRAQRLLLLLRMPQARMAADQAVELNPLNVPALKFRARLA